MGLTAGRVRRVLLLLLALAFLAGSTLAATHVHAWASGAGAPGVSTDQHKGNAIDAVCPMCFGLQAGSGLPPDSLVLTRPEAVSSAPQIVATASARAPLLAFRSRAPPPG